MITVTFPNTVETVEMEMRINRELAEKPQIGARLIAFYLPQFHPIPENDEWWGKGFTEWTNVAKAKPLFRGHYQPHIPADLGFYDLRVPEVREAQAEMARESGIEAFCYWHYWFAGERLLERPFQEVLETGRPDFPFCLGWANHSWNGLWSGGDTKRILKQQTYPGIKDYERHFEFLLRAFDDPRYVRVQGSPLFVIFKPLEIPDCRIALDYWRELAAKAGLPGLHIVANLDYHEKEWDAEAQGFDAVTVWPLGAVLGSRNYLWRARLKRSLKLRRELWRLQMLFEGRWPGRLHIYDYTKILSKLISRERVNTTHYPMVVPNWDSTPRYAENAIVLHNSNPDSFRSHLRDVLQQVETKPVERRIVFIKSWNEWAEGNHLEPDLRFGHGYLMVIREELGLAVEHSVSSLVVDSGDSLEPRIHPAETNL